MRWILVFLFALSCGGKIVGGDTPASDAGADSNDPLGGGGNLLSGKCHFASSFKPNGGDWIFQTDSDGVSTAARPTSMTFTTLCAGKGNESFYYELSTSAVATAAGSYMAQGQLNQVSNGREAEVTEWGDCTIAVASITRMQPHDIAAGSFDCPGLKTLTGMFSMKGTFTVPLP